MTSITALSELVDVAWDQRSNLNRRDHMDHITAIHDTLRLLDEGALRIAEKKDNKWHIHQWAKKAIVLSFRVLPMQLMADSPQSRWYDKIHSKWYDWNADQFEKAGFRAVPDCRVRHSAYIAPGAVLMPCFINAGAYVDENTMIDTWSTIGACAQIGKNCHISGGTGIGGVLEPLQANPVIIEDNCFIGARSEIAEGVIVEEGSVISMGTFISASTKIIDRTTGDISYGRIPPYSVVIPGSMPTKTTHEQPIHLNCAVIIKKVDEKTRSKTDLNDLLRD